jgi:hypothetical protein
LTKGREILDEGRVRKVLDKWEENLLTDRQEIS